MTTVAARLGPRPDPRIPDDTDAVRWRPATPDDVDAMLACYRAMDAVDHPDYTTHRDEIADDFGVSHVDPRRDTLLALGADGEVLAVGWSILAPEYDDAVPVYTTGGVRPSARGRGLGRELLRWQRERALQQLSGVDEDLPARMTTWIDDRAVSAQHLLERDGFTVGRWFLTLTRDLADPIPELPIDDLVVRSPDDADEELVRVGRNTSFQDHWGSQPRSVEQWTRMWRESTARHDLSSIATTADGELAAFVLASVNPDDFGPQGFSSVFIGLVGTLPGFRRRGLAGALLARTLRLAAAEGLERAVLDVDSESGTGAVGLYERIGFAPTGRIRAYVLDV